MTRFSKSLELDYSIVLAAIFDLMLTVEFNRGSF